MPVNKENMRKAVSALRSGQFTQGYGCLEQIEEDGTRSNCCLGVITRIAMENGVELDTTLETDGKTTTFSDGQLIVHGMLPDPVVEWLSIDERDPIIDYEISLCATEANDVAEWDFNKIADAFERTYLSDETN